jgi:hypothetical protein
MNSLFRAITDGVLMFGSTASWVAWRGPSASITCSFHKTCKYRRNSPVRTPREGCDAERNLLGFRVGRQDEGPGSPVVQFRPRGHVRRHSLHSGAGRPLLGQEEATRTWPSTGGLCRSRSRLASEIFVIESCLANVRDEPRRAQRQFSAVGCKPRLGGTSRTPDDERHARHDVGRAGGLPALSVHHPRKVQAPDSERQEPRCNALRPFGPGGATYDRCRKQDSQPLFIGPASNSAGIMACLAKTHGHSVDGPSNVRPKDTPSMLRLDMHTDILKLDPHVASTLSWIVLLPSLFRPPLLQRNATNPPSGGRQETRLRPFVVVTGMIAADSTIVRLTNRNPGLQQRLKFRHRWNVHKAGRNPLHLLSY